MITSFMFGNIGFMSANRLSLVRLLIPTIFAITLVFFTSALFYIDDPAANGVFRPLLPAAIAINFIAVALMRRANRERAQK
jgi:hypothetical protein